MYSYLTSSMHVSASSFFRFMKVRYAGRILRTRKAG